MENTKVKFSLRSKFIILISIVLLISISIIVYNALNLFHKDALNNVFVSTDIISMSKAEEVFTTFSASIDKVLLVSKIIYENKSNKALHRSLINSLFNDQLQFTALYIQQLKGLGFITKYSFAKKKFFTDYDLKANFFDNLIKISSPTVEAINNGQVIIKNVSNSNIPLLSVAVPFVKNNRGAYDHMVLAIMKLDRIIEKFRENGIYTIYLVDNEGSVLAHPLDKNVINKVNLRTNEIVNKMLLSSVRREFSEFVSPQTGEKTFGSYCKVGVSNIGVIAEVPKKVAFEAIYRLFWYSIIFTIIVMMISFMLAYGFSQKITQPLQKLTQAATSIAKGVFSTKVEVNTNDEVANLAKAFNNMSVELDLRQKEIQKRIKNLSIIHESTQEISAKLEIDSLLSFFIVKVRELLRAESVGVWVIEDFNVKNEAVQGDFDKATVLEIYKELLNLKTSKYDDNSINVPLIDMKGKVFGHLLLQKTNSKEPYDTEDLYMAETLLASLSIALKNIDLLLESIEKARMEKELETTRLVQETLFPPSELLFDNLQISSFYEPASECGGDWWGTFQLESKQHVLMIADATGHGAPAALLTATAKSAFTTVEYIAKTISKFNLTSASLLKILNKAVYESAKGKILMTFFLCIIDKTSRKIFYSNASHNFPYYYSIEDNEIKTAQADKSKLHVFSKAKGPRIGEAADVEYEIAEEILPENSKLVFYTDGFEEAINVEKQNYGERRFRNSLLKNMFKDVNLMRDSVVSEFRDFIKDEALQDDVTLLIASID